jgi:hypothetical protein
MITDRDLAILRFIATHFAVTAAQVKRHCVGDAKDQDGRITRRRLNVLVHGRLIQRARCEVVNPVHGFTSSVYFPARPGLELLAMRTSNPEWLKTPTQKPPWQNLRHWTILSDVRLMLYQAVTQQTRVTMPTFLNEFDVINPGARQPEQRYRLWTLCATTPRRIVCCPDAAFLLQLNTAQRALYVELETGANAPQKAAAEKSPGYAALAEQRLHWRHFPGSMDTFGVLCIAPDPEWRDGLRRAFRTKPGADLWKFAAITELNADTILFAPLFYPASDGPPVPLVKGGAA